MIDIKNLKVNLENKILASEQVIIVPHKGVDFDAIASSIGLSLIAEKLKRPSHIIVSDPIYEIDHGVQLIISEAKTTKSIINHERYQQVRTNNDFYILADVNKKNLIHPLEGLTKENTAIIDHHNIDEKTLETKVAYIDSSVSSASVIIENLLCAYNIKYSPEVANYLLTGILLDTNKLTKNVTSETMKTVTRLLENGANMTKANDYFIEDFNSDRRVQELVNSTRFLSYTIAIIMGKEDEEYTKEELAKATDYLLKYKVDAAYAIGKIAEDTVSISARSKESINVGEVMQELNGGGNQYSGATKIVGETIEETRKKLIKAISPPHFVKPL